MKKDKNKLEELARMSQGQFEEIQGDIRSLRRDIHDMNAGLESVREHMATHDDVSALRQEMHADFEHILRKVRDEIHKGNYAVEIDGLHRRVKRLEEFSLFSFAPGALLGRTLALMFQVAGTPIVSPEGFHPLDPSWGTGGRFGPVDEI